MLAIVALGGALLWDTARQERGLLLASRGFYGVLRVVREEPGEPDEYVKLLHGRSPTACSFRRLLAGRS